MITRTLLTLFVLASFAVSAAVTNITSNTKTVSVDTNGVLVSPTFSQLIQSNGWSSLTATLGSNATAAAWRAGLGVSENATNANVATAAGTSGYIPLYTATNSIGNSTLFKSGVNYGLDGGLTIGTTSGTAGDNNLMVDGTVGIGATPSASYPLFMNKSQTNMSWSNLGYLYGTFAYNTNGAYWSQGLYVNLSSSYCASGASNSSSVAGLRVESIINNTNHKGALSAAYGVVISHGAGASMHADGVITNSYGLQLTGARTAGTVGTLWGISESGNDKNYFGATSTGFGTTTPAAKVAINGGLHVGGDSDPGDNNLLVDGSTYVSTALYTLAAVATNTISVGTITVNTNAVIAGSSFTKATNFANVVMGTNYISADKSIGGTMTFTNYTRTSDDTAMVTNVWTFKNGLFITNIITQ